MKKIKLADIQNKIQTISLSDALQHYKMDDDKVSLVQKCIKNINSVPSRFHNIQSLFLSGNFIVSLEHIGQFRMLKNLSLANNCINDIFELNNLAELHRLENVSLQLNPVTKHLFYRCWVVYHCKTLRNLDSANITMNDHRQLNELFVQIQQKFDKMVRNYWTMEKICNFARKIDIHRQVNKKQQCCTMQTYNKFMKVCHFDPNLTNHIWLSLYEDCVVIYNSLTSKQRLMDCIDHLTSKQHEKIKELQQKLFRKIEYSHRQQRISDSDLFSEMESRIINTQKASNARSIWLKLNIFIALRQNAQNAANQRKTVQKKKKAKIVFGIAFNILHDLFKNHIKKAFRAFHTRQQDNRYEIIKEKRLNKQLLLKFIKIWKDQYFKKRIENQTKALCCTFQEMKAKQARYLQKIQLLEEYNRILKESHAKQIEDLNMTRRIMAYDSISSLTKSKIQYEQYYGSDFKENESGAHNRRQRVLNRRESPCKQTKKREFIYRQE